MRTSFSLTLVAASCMLGGCTFAQYSKLHVQDVDQQTQVGVPGAQLRTFYRKPMLDMTYQRKDHKKTDHGGFATLTIATNWSQLMILGRTYGISPQIAIEAEGYAPREFEVGGIGGLRVPFNRSNVVHIQIEKVGGIHNPEE